MSAGRPRLLKDPAAVLDYKFLWGAASGVTAWLDIGETLTSQTVTVEPSDGLVVESTASVDDGANVLVWLSGGALDVVYTVRCFVQTSASRTDVRSMTLSVQER